MEHINLTIYECEECGDITTVPGEFYETENGTIFCPECFFCDEEDELDLEAILAEPDILLPNGADSLVDLYCEAHRLTREQYMQMVL